jgi:hypothetical protein
VFILFGRVPFFPADSAQAAGKQKAKIIVRDVIIPAKREVAQPGIGKKA